MKNMSNQVQIIGRLGAEPEVKTLENGGKLARFNVAVSEQYTKRNGEKVKDVHWHSVVAWGNLAGIAERILHKGSRVNIDGKLLNRVYVNKEGKRQMSSEIVANAFMLLDSKPKAEQS